MFSLLLATLVCFGDSVTAGVGVSQGAPTFCDSLDGINAGVPSDDTSEALLRFEPDVLSNKPDQVIIMFGLNDSLSLTPQKYRLNIRTMVYKLKYNNIKILLLTPNYTLRPYLNKAVQPFVRILKRYSRNQDIPLVDVYKRFKHHSDLPSLLDADLAHPNALGHRFIYRIVKGITLSDYL